MRYIEILQEAKIEDDHFNMDNLNVHSRMSRETLVYMTPEDFLKLIPPDFLQTKLDNVTKVGNSGTKFEQPPFLRFTHDDQGHAQVVGHEGRHRAQYLFQKGVTKMPVLLQCRENPGKAIRWGKAHIPDIYEHIPIMPKTITGEDGRHTIPMPKSAIYPPPEE